MQENTAESDHETAPALTLDPPTPRRRSASQLASYSACGEAYRLERVAKAPQRPAAWFFQGTAVHHAIEQWEESRREMPLDELENEYLTVYRSEANEAIEAQGGELGAFMTGGNKRPDTDLSDREAIGWYQVQDYIRLAEDEADIWTVVASELEFNVDVGGVPVNGFIDQVVYNHDTGYIHPRDIKTGNNMPPTPVQLALYTLGLLDIERKAHEANEAPPWGEAGQILSVYAEWLKGGRPPSASGKTPAKPTEIIPMDLSDWGEDRVAVWLTQMDQAERAGIYIPNPSSSCTRMCPVAQYCTVMGEHMPSVQQYARTA
jgi:hypothetical protein